MPLRTILMIMAFSEEYNLDNNLYICFRICIFPVNACTYKHGTSTILKLGLWLRLECSLDSLSIDSAHVIYVAEGHNVGAERQSSVMTLRKPIVTWII